MCIHCAGDYPIEEVDAETLEMVVGLIEDLYDLEPMGGPLHVALDDWNLEDRHWTPRWGDCTDEVFHTAVNISIEMLRLTVGQRNYIMIEWEKQA